MSVPLAAARVEKVLLILLGSIQREGIRQISASLSNRQSLIRPSTRARRWAGSGLSLDELVVFTEAGLRTRHSALTLAHCRFPVVQRLWTRPDEMFDLSTVETFPGVSLLRIVNAMIGETISCPVSRLFTFWTRLPGSP